MRIASNRQITKQPQIDLLAEIIYTSIMQRTRGFTIVELLVVIVVIAILAAITIVSYNGINQRSQAAAVASDLRATIKGFALYKEATGMSTWAHENDASWNGNVTGNPTITSMIPYNASFREFVPKAPQTTGLGAGASAWLYDNDTGTFANCVANSDGVNIILQNVTNLTVAQLVDEALDDGDRACGLMHMSGTSLIYNISRSP